MASTTLTTSSSSRPSSFRRSTAPPNVSNVLSLIGSDKPLCAAQEPAAAKPDNNLVPPGLKTAILSSFSVEKGYTFPSVTVSYQTWGALSSSADNAILVCHSLTSAADLDNWWPELLGNADGKAFDTSNYFVICVNVLGSPYGTTSPLSVNPATGKTYGASFPQTTLRDDVRLQRRLLETLGVRSLAAVVGGSLGGMLALEFATMYPAFVKSLVCIAAPARTSAWALGFSCLQRAMLHQPGGLGLARMLAMVSYRTPASYNHKFGRAIQAAAPANGKKNQTYDKALQALAGAHDKHSVHSYLAYQGTKFESRFDATCYSHLTYKLDDHDVLRGRLGSHIRDDALPAAGSAYEAAALRQVLECVPRTLVVGIASDHLFPLADVQRLADVLPKAEMYLLDSNDGHDGFLIEQSTLNSVIDNFLKTT